MALVRASLLVRAAARVAVPTLSRGFAAVQPDAGEAPTASNSSALRGGTHAAAQAGNLRRTLRCAVGG